MSRVWFLSDLHIADVRVAQRRGFDAAADHDRVLANRWDRVVRRGDEVWVLGDISSGHGYAEHEALHWLAQRPGTKHLVAGNHDGVHPMYRGSDRAEPVYLQVFASVAACGATTIAGHTVTLSHFPFRGSAPGGGPLDTRFRKYRSADTGQFLLHGHTHSGVAVPGRQLHVALDAHRLRPVPLRWVEQQIARYPIRHGSLVGSAHR